MRGEDDSNQYTIMKIAYILPSLANAGPIIVARDLVEVMQAHGHECEVFYIHDTKEIDFPCTTTHISFLHGIDYNRYDVVHSHCMVCDIYQFVHKPLSCKANVITTVHNFIFDDIHSYHSWISAELIAWCWLFSLNRIDRLVQLSKQAVVYYKKWYSEKKLRVAYNTRIFDESLTATPEETKLIQEFRQDKKLIGINASLLQRKGIDQVIKALKDLPECKLIVVGRGNQEETLKVLAHQLGVADQVLFLGYVKDAYRLLPLYDLYIMSSRSEGFPLCTLESVKYKVNVALSDIPLFRELYTEDEVTFFQLENIPSLVSAIRYALSHHKADMAYKKYMESYSPEVFYQSYLKIYQNKD